jgi:hypothetical protein
VTQQIDGASLDQPTDTGASDSAGSNGGQDVQGVGVGPSAAGDGGPDLASLTEEQLAALPDQVRGFHADYTRKTQALADQQRQVEEVAAELERR